MKIESTTKKIIGLLGMIVSLPVMVASTGCAFKGEVKVSDNNFPDITKIRVMNSKEYVYDSDTKIVYVLYNSGITPYISAEGTYCKYVDGKIINVGSDVAVTEGVKGKGYEFMGSEEVAETACESATADSK